MPTRILTVVYRAAVLALLVFLAARKRTVAASTDWDAELAALLDDFLPRTKEN